MSWARAGAVAAALALTVMGCNRAPTPDTTVALGEWVVATAGELPAGSTVLAVRNHGQAHHNLTICPGEAGRCDAPSLVQEVLVKPSAARDPDSLPDRTSALVVGTDWEVVAQVELEPGSYRFYCAIVGHAQRGMDATVVATG